MHTLFIESFEKISGIKRKLRFISLGKDKAIKIMRGGSFDTRQRAMGKLVGRQSGILQPMVKSMGEAEGKGIARGREKLRKQIKASGFKFGGTISKGKKGKRSYIDPDALKKVKKQMGGPSLRNVVHHEEFHRKVPILGNSEIAAHFWGGLNQTKKKRNNLGQAARDAFVHLPKTRPGRFSGEVGIGVGGAYGAKKLVDKVRSKDKNKKKK